MHPDEPSHRRGPASPSQGMLGQVLRALLGEPKATASSRRPQRSPSWEVPTVDLERLRDETAASERAAHGGFRAPTDPAPGERAEATAVMAPEEELVEDPGVPGADVDPRVLSDLQHPTSRVRLETLQALQRDPKAAPVVAVTARLQDPEPRVREAAVALLGDTGDERMLVLLLEAMDDPSEQVRLAVRQAILDRAAPSLIELLLRELHVPARCAAAAAMLVEMEQTDGVVEAMRRVGPAARRIIADVLRGASTVERLIEDLTDGRPDRRRLAVERLGLIEARDALDPVLERLEDPDRGVRIKAAEALGRIGDPRAMHALKRSLVWDPDMGVAVAVGHALRSIAGSGDARTVRV